LFFVTMSFSRPDTNLGNQNTWPFLYDGIYDVMNAFSLNERNIVIPNFCYPGTLPYSVFIGLQAAAGPGPTLSIVISTDNAGFDLARVSDYGLAQTRYSLGTTAFAIKCGADGQDVIPCPSAGYDGKLGYGTLV
jgi:hypothetical protein